MIDPQNIDPIGSYLSHWAIIHLGIGGLALERAWQFYSVWKKKSNGSFVGYKDITDSVAKLKEENSSCDLDRLDMRKNIERSDEIQKLVNTQLSKDIDEIKVSIVKMDGKIDELLRK